MEYSLDEKAMIWLNSVTEIDYRLRVALLRKVDSPKQLFTDWKEICKQVIKEGGERVYMKREPCSEADELLSRMERDNVYAVTLLGEDYPESLKAIPAPPLTLYCKGRRELLSRRKFCIVGSRITPPWAEKQARSISEALSERFTIVTGFAEGGDRAAIDGAIEHGVLSVFPVGLDRCYPAGHAALKEKVLQNGLIVSEYPLGTELRKYHFQARNRILAGLAEGVLVVSARQKRSGALMTSTYAAEFGREVFAFPYNIGVEQGGGCNDLIKQGACLVTGAEDIYSAFGITYQAKEKPKVTEEEAEILAVLRESGELHTAVLAERVGKPPYAILATLSALELKNLVIKSGGNRYSAV
jgi:DNA processing protein